MQAGYETANQLFDKMHFSIFRAPMSFFDATPSGRILSRVSSVQTAVDLSIPYSIGPFAYAIIQLLCIVLVMSLGAWPVFLVFFPVVGICIWLQQYYIPPARELARFVGVCKAPVIQHFFETISGSTTIRSFDQKVKNTIVIDDYLALMDGLVEAIRRNVKRVYAFTNSQILFDQITNEEVPENPLLMASRQRILEHVKNLEHLVLKCVPDVNLEPPLHLARVAIGGVHDAKSDPTVENCLICCEDKPSFMMVTLKC
ncbi:putative ABC-type xenobiotic transporter [Helianthus anomalus]